MNCFKKTYTLPFDKQLPSVGNALLTHWFFFFSPKKRFIIFSWLIWKPINHPHISFQVTTIILRKMCKWSNEFS